MFVAKRILIITNEMKFALNVKKALEKDGRYAVAVFSSGKAGVDYVRQNPQDVVVLDFRMKDMPGTDMVDHMRTLQHDIAIIAAPNHPAIHDLKERYNIQQVVNIPVSVRKFVTTLELAVKNMQETNSDTSQAKPLDGFSIGRNAQTIEFWLADNEEGETVLEVSASDEPDITPESSATFQRLLAEEPPMPNFVDGSTIRDLRDRLSNLDEIKRVLASAAEDDDTEASDPIIESDSDSIPAIVILEAALDESTPIRTFSLQEFMQRVNESEISEISPLPSWKREDERYIVEPDFLPTDLPFPELDEAIEYTGTVTLANATQLEEEDPGNWVTDPIEPVQRSRPKEQEAPPPKPESMPESQVIEPPTEADALDDTEAMEHVAELGRPAPPLPPELPDLAVSQGTDRSLPFIDFDDEDSELAQLATTLTQVALELTADATVLARDGAIVAYAGKLPMSDLEGLMEQLTVEWDKASGSDKSRILFATIPETGAEFMVSTRGTEFGFTLSLIFSGTRPLHDIRRQSKRLIDALATLPEPEPELAVETQASEPIVTIPTTEEIGLRKPIAYLWLQSDSNASFDEATQQRITKALEAELLTSGWVVDEVQANDYIYIYGEMPESLNPRETLTELMQEAAQAIKADASSVWDDSYLILQPGREMKAAEIQRFIDFARR